MKKFTPHFDKNNILAHVGDISQIAGVRRGSDLNVM